MPELEYGCIDEPPEEYEPPGAEDIDDTGMPKGKDSAGGTDGVQVVSVGPITFTGGGAMGSAKAGMASPAASSVAASRRSSVSSAAAGSAAPSSVSGAGEGADDSAAAADKAKNDGDNDDDDADAVDSGEESSEFYPVSETDSEEEQAGNQGREFRGTEMGTIEHAPGELGAKRVPKALVEAVTGSLGTGEGNIDGPAGLYTIRAPHWSLEPDKFDEFKGELHIGDFEAADKVSGMPCDAMLQTLTTKVM